MSAAGLRRASSDWLVGIHDFSGSRVEGKLKDFTLIVLLIIMVTAAIGAAGFAGYRGGQKAQAEAFKAELNTTIIKPVSGDDARAAFVERYPESTLIAAYSEHATVFIAEDGRTTVLLGETWVELAERE